MLTYRVEDLEDSLANRHSCLTPAKMRA